MSGNNIKVVCRFRPMNSLEKAQQSSECVDVDLATDTIRMKGADKDGFTFDKVFPSESQQHQVFDFGVKGIVEDVMSGFNGTLFCYGQTGSGKSYTMMGADIENPELKGLIPRITEQIFQSIASADANIEYTVKVSYMEIYMEKIKDLLNPVNDNLTIHEDKARGVYVKGLTEVYVGGDMEVYAVMKAGGKSRAVTATNMNAESSRSHSIFVIGIHQRNVETGSQKSGHLYLVDLAGSEKVGKTGATGQTLEEAKKINKSLSALGMVINSLTDGKSVHIPYRDSKLTRLLQESLGGNSRTTLIINCSPASYNEAETLSTLRFGMRAKSIKNKARINTEMSPAELKVMLGKIKGELFFCESYRDALLGEVTVWRTGGTVDEPDWATEDKVRMLVMGSNGKPPAGTTEKRLPTTPVAGGRATPSSPMPSSISQTSTRSPTPGFDNFSSPSGRATPATSRLDLDERDEFLRRENELEDQVAEKETALAAQEKFIADMKDELTYLRERNEQLMKGQSAVDLEVAELRASQQRLEEEAKENLTNLETAKDREVELSNELDSMKMQVQELKQAQAVVAADDREKRKAEMLADMMAKIDTGGALDAGSEKLRAILSKLDSNPDEATAAGLVLESRETIRRHLADVRDMQDRSRRSQEELQLMEQRKVELEELLATREKTLSDLLAQGQFAGADELKDQLEAQYAFKQHNLEGECTSLRKRLNAKDDELNRMQDHIEEQATQIEDLNRMIAQTTAGIDGGREYALASQELERTRRAAETQQAEFEAMKRNLMRDVTDRCEKVVELQMQLDELKEKYKAVSRATNAKAHNKKMQMLEFNMAQLNEVQRGLVHQNTSLKKDLNTAERKLSERKERIVNLERLVAQSENQLKVKESEYQRNMRDIRERNMQLETIQQASGGLNFNRIAKPLRGGGGPQQPNVQSNQLSPSYSAPGSMPPGTFSRLQDDNGTMKRQSWFSRN